MKALSYKLISITSVTVGITSLVAFFVLVLYGPFGIIKLNLGNTKSLLFNAVISIIFFAQHSVMVRGSIQEKIKTKLPPESFFAFHSIISGSLLLTLSIVWQSSHVFITINKPYSYCLVSIQLLSIAGLIWGIKSLKDFDPFGRKQISRHLKKQNKKREGIFVYTGPYNFIRHPFYFFILLMIWSHPTISADRLLFIILWTAWVTIGTILEEKDLVKEIGPAYQEYQNKVPMLIPYKIYQYLPNCKN
jgi:protein-S-isoprenylcysteine O-methyltransferase Ste14